MSTNRIIELQIKPSATIEENKDSQSPAIAHSKRIRSYSLNIDPAGLDKVHSLLTISDTAKLMRTSHGMYDFLSKVPPTINQINSFFTTKISLKSEDAKAFLIANEKKLQKKGEDALESLKQFNLISSSEVGFDPIIELSIKNLVALHDRIINIFSHQSNKISCSTKTLCLSAAIPASACCAGISFLFAGPGCCCSGLVPIISGGVAGCLGNAGISRVMYKTKMGKLKFHKEKVLQFIQHAISQQYIKNHVYKTIEKDKKLKLISVDAHVRQQQDEKRIAEKELKATIHTPSS